MPLGKEESSYPGQLVEKKIFTGKGSLEIPALRKIQSQQHSSDVDSPSPSSTTTTPYFSSSEDTYFTPDVKLTGQTSQKSSSGGCTYNTPYYNVILAPSPPNVTVSALNAIRLDTSKLATKELDHLASCNTDKHSYLSENSVSASKSFGHPFKRECNRLRMRKLSHGSLDYCTHETSLAPRESLSPTDSDFVYTGPVDFVHSVDSNQTTMSPDFVDVSSSANLQTLSRQPNLSELLSGSVKSCRLLKENPDFIPLAVLPKETLKVKSKSLSDLSKRNEKIQKYLDRRKVIHMDRDDEDCCSHTEVAPSSMMTLAMELLVSKNNTAANLFEEAKKKVYATDDDKDSILPGLWVVPKTPCSTEDIKQASHLEPSLKSTPKVTLRRKNDVDLRGDQGHATVLQSIGQGVCRRSGYAYPTAKCIPVSKQTVDDVHHKENNQKQTVGEIINEDIENDLKTLTVADLVGSPDTVFTETESESDIPNSGHRACSSSATSFQLRNQNTKSTDEKIGPHDFCRSASSRSCSKTCEIENLENVQLMKNSTDTLQCQRNYSIDDTLGLESIVEAKSARDKPQRRSSSLSVSSSLTTVSSLSSSSNSVASTEHGRCIKLTPTLCHIYDDSDHTTKNTNYSEEKYQDEFIHNNERLGGTRSQQLLDLDEYESGTSLPIEHVVETHCDVANPPARTGMVPKPPRRVKSIGIMNKIRKNTREKDSFMKLKKYATDYGNKDLILRNIEDKTSTANCCDDDLIRMPIANDDDNDEDIHSINTERAVVSRSISREECSRRPSHLNQCGQVPQEDDLSEKAAVTQECHLHSNSYGNAAAEQRVPMDMELYFNTNEDIPTRRRHVEAQIPRDINLPRAAEIKFDSLGEDNQVLYYDMEKERWFRNGQISVVDGSRVALAGTRSRKGEAGSRFNDTSPTALRPTANLFLSDVLGGESLSPTKVAEIQVEEDIVAVTQAATLESTAPENYEVKADKNKNRVILPKGVANSPEGKTNSSPASAQSISKITGEKNIGHPEFEKRRVRNEINSCSAKGNQDIEHFLNHSYGQVGRASSSGYLKDVNTGSRTSVAVQPALSGSGTKTDFKESQETSTKSSGMAVPRIRSPVPTLVTSSCFISTSSMNPERKCTENETNALSHRRGITGSDGNSYEMAELTSDKSFNVCPTPFCASPSGQKVIQCRDTKPGRNTPSPIGYNQQVKENYMPTTVNPGFEAAGAHWNSNTKQERSSGLTSGHAVNHEGKRSPINFTAEGKPVYSSSIKIVVAGGNSSTKTTTEQDELSGLSPEENPKSKEIVSNQGMDKGYLYSKRLSPTPLEKSVVRESKSMNVREAAATVDMKLSEATNGPKADAPQHSSVDEMDFAGVVDGPTKNVKEIRAMFKAQDHANYAKPKLVMKKSAPPIVAPKPKMRPEKISAGGSNRNSAEVAQQVMGLFKGALELEQQVQQQPPSKPETQEERTEHSEPEIPFKEKIASFSEGKSPKQGQEINNNRNSTQRDSQSEEKRDAPYAEIIKNPSPVAVSNGHERKSSVKQEKVLAESYDESLDQFYDVFDQLTTR